MTWASLADRLCLRRRRIWWPWGMYGIVPAGELSFAVVLYCCVACIVVLFQIYRRAVVGADFGGKSSTQSYVGAAALILLWVVYTTLACGTGSVSF
mmetsp:Transcript_3086/g.8138  ORF Transcript_3086/g.8138 Transcript_3086/m.8138 type:complete len:96 (-) Transcript_3086:119-406(-)